MLLNTCSVRDMADQKALGKMGMLGRLAKERPHMVFGFLGCMAQARGASLLKNLPHVDLVVGTQKFHRVADYVDELVASKTARSAIAPCQNRSMDDLRFSIVDIDEEAGSQSTIRNQQLGPRQATAFVSIMQGCNMHCTFCIVPQTRGAERSRSIDEIVGEVRDLVSRGVKEVTLLGQIVNLYGRHEFPKRDNKSPFVQLLESVNEIEGLGASSGFTSPHPIGFRDDLIDAISRSAETCRARSFAVAIRLEQNSQSDAPRLHGGEIFRSGRANPAGAQGRRDYHRHHRRVSRRDRRGLPTDARFG